MSKHETKMTRWYAKTRHPKGFLMEEYLAQPQGEKSTKRLLDGVIVFRKPFVKRKLIKGERVVVIQSKHRRLGMGLIGQVIVSRDLLKSKGFKVIESVGVCAEMDNVMQRLLRKYQRCRAVVFRAF
ncbi:MAG: hypothetical protein ACK467_10490 [Opitutia bacterium]